MVNQKSDFEAVIRQAGPIVLNAKLACAPGQLLALVGRYVIVGAAA